MSSKNHLASQPTANHLHHADASAQAPSAPGPEQNADSDACESLQSCVREIELFGGATLMGSTNAAIERWHQDPNGLLRDASTFAATGFVLGAACEFLPVVALSAGSMAGAAYLCNTFDSSKHLARDRVCAEAWRYAWHDHDAKKLDYYKGSVADKIGAETFDFVLCSAASLSGSAMSGLMIDTVRTMTAAEFYGYATSAPYLPRIGTNAMARYVGGDLHALAPGRLPLRTEPVIRIESPVRMPQTKSPGLQYYIERSRPRSRMMIDSIAK